MTNILLLGDSITKGQYVNPAFTWPSLLQLDQDLKDRNLHFYTSCISGETSTKALDRLIVELESYPPDVLVVQIGLNDANHWKSEGGKHPRTSPNRFQANLNEMIQRAKLNGVSQIVISTMHQVYKEIECNGKPFEFYRSIYNDIIRNVAIENQVINFDLDQICKEEFKRDFLLPEPDLLHLSQSGHYWLYRHFKDFIILHSSKFVEKNHFAGNFELNQDWR
jgi:lysophospholipase L1-like esterase